MLGAREDIDEPPQDQMKASLRVARRQFGDRRLFTNDMDQFRDELDHQDAVRIQGFAQCLAPLSQLFIAFAEQRSDEALKGLRQRRVRNVALELVKLTRAEQATGRD